MRGKNGHDDPGLEGQGEVIAASTVGEARGAGWSITARPVPLSTLDASEDLFQSGFWGSFKQAHGWKAHAFEVTVGDAARARTAAADAPMAPGATFGLLVLTRTLARAFTIAYVPFGPSYEPSSRRALFLSALAGALRGQLPRNTLFLRYDLPWVRGVAGGGSADGAAGASEARPRDAGAPRLDEQPYVGRPRVMKSAHDVQPASTVLVDLSPPLEAVLGSMKSKTRYNIRLAEKKGVAVGEAGVEALDDWYRLYEETARRDRIGIHGRRYYEGLLKAPGGYPGASPRVSLLLARHEGDLLAGNIVVFWKSRAAYLYGASSGLKRNLMPTYALQWQAMRIAREAGCTSYDFFGVPPRPDPGHPMFGLYQFKTGFHDEVVERWGTWDAPYRSALYACYLAAEALRMFYYRTLKKRLRDRPQANDA